MEENSDSLSRPDILRWYFYWLLELWGDNDALGDALVSTNLLILLVYRLFAWLTANNEEFNTPITEPTLLELLVFKLLLLNELFVLFLISGLNLEAIYSPDAGKNIYLGSFALDWIFIC